MKKHLLSILMILSATVTCLGGESAASEDRYLAQEISIDAGPTLIAHEPGFDSILKTPLNRPGNSWGMTLGGNVFLSEYLGVRLDSTIFRIDDVSGVDQTTLGPIIRLPSNKTGFSPFARVAVDRLWQADRWGLSAAAGLEYRVTEYAGVVLDAGYHFLRAERDSLQISLLLRYRFP
jgi:hypothetical protein